MTNRSILPALLCAALALGGLCAPLRAVVTIDLVPVGDAGNAADTTGHGAVGYSYEIGAYEVTNGQYTEFLNVVAKTDPLGLYNAAMATDAQGGITRSGTEGSFTYVTKPGFDNKPVNLVSYYDALRFVNWLANAQIAGGTETGSYELLGGTATPSNATSIARNPAATYVIPSEDEWYKAAYYHGGTATYTLYPTQSDTEPNTVDPNSTDANSANYRDFTPGASSRGVTPVGSYTLAKSYYGTFDQGGNVIERDEAVINTGQGSRGGSWHLPPAFLKSTARDYDPATLEFNDIGFRVGVLTEPVPIPSPTPTPTPGPTVSPTPTPTPSPTATPAPLPRPSVVIHGRKTFPTTAATIVLRGTASDLHGRLDRVEVRIADGPFFPANGRTDWRCRVPLNEGRNRIKVRAVDATGQASPIKTVLVIRK